MKDKRLRRVHGAVSGLVGEAVETPLNVLDIATDVYDARATYTVELGVASKQAARGGIIYKVTVQRSFLAYIKGSGRFAHRFVLF